MNVSATAGKAIRPGRHFYILDLVLATLYLYLLHVFPYSLVVDAPVSP